MGKRAAWFAGLAVLATVASSVLIAKPPAIFAQSPLSLSDENALSLVLPPLANGARPGVHLWARADQSNGPGGLPTVFLVTLYTKQTANGPEEHEVVNYVQASGGSWAPARPRDDGTLLIDDWAWISLNLTNLTATAGGQGNASTYTVDYTSAGTYAGTPRQIMLEEVYAADLSLISSVVLSDSSSTSVSPSTPAATVRPSVPAVASTPASVPTQSNAATPVRPASTPVGVTYPSATPTPGLPVR
jgi:hypothetical protein